LLASVLKPFYMGKVAATGTHHKTRPGFITGRDLQWLLQGILSRAIASRYIRGENAASLGTEREPSKLAILLDAKKVKARYEPESDPGLPHEEIAKFMTRLRLIGSPPIAPKRDRVIHCAICEGPHAPEIIAARAKGASPENLARQFGTPRGSMSVHLQQHVGRPFIRSLQGCALEFLILTCAPRREQVATARWDEIDFDKRQWDCSKHKSRNRVKKDHIILLNTPALALLYKMKEWQKINGIESAFVFDKGVRGRAAGKPLGRDSLTKFLERVMKINPKDATVLGFRTTFRSWSRDTGQNEVAAEMAAGRGIGSKEAQLYSRDARMIDIRRAMYEDWGAYCDRPEPLPSSVTPIRPVKQEAAA
jgi:hypothetical protein